jgi:CelD/BcsL family acetyltransferase involved in cellulose biosynthesis
MSDNTPARIRWEAHPARALATNTTLHAQWNELNAACTGQVFLDAEAVVCALEHFGKGDEQLYIGGDGEHIQCMTVLTKTGAMRWSTFQPSQLPLGAFLITPNAPLDTTTESLIRSLPGMALVLSITQIDPLYVQRPADTTTLRLDDYIETGWIELRGTFEEYWAARGKNLRQNMRKQLNRLAAEGVKAEVRMIRQADQMEAAVGRYGDLESAGWKAESGTAIHSSNSQGLFYSKLLALHASKDNAVVFEYWLDGKLAASNLCLVREKSLVILKTTYDEAHSQLSPAFLLLQAEVQSAYESRGASRVEFYGRKRDWHTRWTEHFRWLYHATIYRNALIKRVAESKRASVPTNSPQQDAAPTPP